MIRDRYREYKTVIELASYFRSGRADDSFLAWRRQPTALFICSAIAIIPVAGWMGRATEALASRMGEGVGGLLNATFGNAAELIIAVIALSKGLTGVVKASITGSIIGNILLVLGLSILCGGTKYREQNFNRTGARTSVISSFARRHRADHSDRFSYGRGQESRRLESGDRAATLVRHRHCAFLHLLLRAWIFAPNAQAFFPGRRK